MYWQFRLGRGSWWKAYSDVGGDNLQDRDELPSLVQEYVREIKPGSGRVIYLYMHKPKRRDEQELFLLCLTELGIGLVGEVRK